MLKCTAIKKNTNKQKITMLMARKAGYHMKQHDFFEFLDLNNDFLIEIELTIQRVLHFNDSFTEETLSNFEKYEQWIIEYNKNRIIE